MVKNFEGTECLVQKVLPKKKSDRRLNNEKYASNEALAKFFILKSKMYTHANITYIA